MAPASCIALASSSSFEDKREEQEDSLELPPPYCLHAERDFSSFPPIEIYCPPSQSSSSNDYQAEQVPLPESSGIEQSSANSAGRRRGYRYNARLGPIGNLVSVVAVASTRAAANTSNSTLRSTLGFVGNYLTGQTERWQYNGLTAAETRYQQQLYTRQWQEQPFIYS